MLICSCCPFVFILRLGGCHLVLRVLFSPFAPPPLTLLRLASCLAFPLPLLLRDAFMFHIFFSLFCSYTLAFPLSEFMISLYSLSLSSVFLSVCLTIQFALYSYHTSHLNFLPIHLKLLRPHFSQLMMYMYRDRLLSDGKFLRDRMYSALCCVSRITQV